MLPNDIRKFLVEDDPEIKLNKKLFSAAAMNPFVEHNSSPRGLMMSSHIAQLVVLNNPEENMIQTGLEYEFGKHALSKRIDGAVEVIAVIDRYKHIITNANTEKVVVYRDLETGEIDCLEMPAFNAYHPYFGFKYKFTEKAETLIIGDTIEDEDLAVPPTMKEDGGYGFGRDVNVAFMSLPEVDEDGFVVSESMCKDFKFKIFEKRYIEVGNDSFLLNLYGDEDNYKPFPDIGEYINDTGVVAASRKYNSEYAPALYSKKDLMEFNPIFDEAVYTREGKGKIIDIKVHNNPNKKKALPSGTDAQCRKYSVALVAFYEQIIQVYERLEQEYGRYNREFIIGNRFNTLVVEALGIVESSNIKSPLKKMYRKEMLDLYRIEFVIEFEYDLSVKNKITDLHGGKGTIVSVWKDEDMPVDANGNRADIIMDPRATISRLNIGRLYERYTKAGVATVTRIVRERFKQFNKSDIYDLTNTEKEDLFRIILEFVDLIQNELTVAYHKVYDSKNYSAMESVLVETIQKGFKIFLAVDGELRKYEIVENLRNSRFRRPYGPVKFTYHGKQKISKENVLIAPMYIILLSKIADTGLYTASAKLNQFGLPIVVSKFDKYRLPNRNSPTRTLGETEGRIFAAYGGREFLAELKDMNASSKTHALVYKNILLADQPTNMPVAVDRSEHAYGTERGLEILNTLWNTVGMELKYIKDEHTEYEYQGGAIDDTITDISEVKEYENVIEDDDMEEETRIVKKEDTK